MFAVLCIFSGPQVIENSRQYLLLRTDILQKTVIGFLWLIFEMPANTLIHSGYSRSYFDLFLIYTVTHDAPKYSKCIPPTFINIKTVVIVQKVDLLQKH